MLSHAVLKYRWGVLWERWPTSSRVGRVQFQIFIGWTARSAISSMEVPVLWSRDHRLETRVHSSLFCPGLGLGLETWRPRSRSWFQDSIHGAYACSTITVICSTFKRVLCHQLELMQPVLWFRDHGLETRAHSSSFCPGLCLCLETWWPRSWSRDLKKGLNTILGSARGGAFGGLPERQQEAQLMLTTGSTPFLRYSYSKNFMTLKWGSKVTQGHWEWYHSIDCVWFAIRSPSSISVPNLKQISPFVQKL